MSKCFISHASHAGHAGHAGHVLKYFNFFNTSTLFSTEPVEVQPFNKHSLTFVSLEEKPAAAAPEPEEEEDMDKTMIITPQARSAMISKNGASPSVASAMPLAGLQIIAGPLAGKSMDLTASLTSLGKGDNCRIKIKGFTVGKQAAVITRRPTGYHIAHLEGMAKPKVNGEIVSDQPRTLKDGDIIELGDTKIEFYIKSA